MRKFLLCTALSTILLTAACNTVRGVGQDVASVGRTVERAAD